MIAASVAADRPRRRWPAWIAGDARAEAMAPAQIDDPALLVARQLFAQVGDFIFAHDLALSAANLEVALAHVAGADPAVSARVLALLAANGTIDDAALDRIAVEAGLRRPGDAVEKLAERLQARLDACIGLAGRSSASAQSYGAAISEGVAQLDDRPAAAISQLRTTAQDLIRTTIEMQGELDRHRREAGRLRGELQRARREADCDHLTGLPNRRGFEARVAEAQPGSPPPIVALCDIDDFKAVNDRHGHQTGDRVLRLVAAHLERELKGKALVGRYGGEEFALFFRRQSPEAAAKAIDAARDKLAQRSLVDQQNGSRIQRVTFSAGLAVLRGDVALAFATADRALYEAKRRGKDQVVMGQD